MTRQSLTALTLAVLVTLSAGTATAQYDNVMGMFFSNTVYNADTTNFESNFAPFNGYIVLFSNEVASVGGYEVGITTSDPGLFVLSASGPNGWTNFGSATNHLCGYMTALPLSGDGTVVLGQLQMLYTYTNSVEISFGPASPSSFGGLYGGIADGDNPDNLIGCIASNGYYDGVVATINGSGIIPHIPDEWAGLAVTIDVDGDTGNVAATRDAATDGYDFGWDIPAAAGSRLHFPHPEWNVPDATDFDEDVRSSFDASQGVQVWTFEVDTAVEDPFDPQVVDLTFSPDFAEASGIGLYIYDRTAGITIPLWNLLSYSYVAYATETRTFDLYVGNYQYGEVDDIEVAVTGHLDGVSDIDNVARTVEGATLGWDGLFDYPEPSPPPSNYFGLSFYHPDWPIGPRFRVDSIDFYDAHTDARIWPMRLETDLTGTATLTFAPNFSVNAGIGLVLANLTTGETINLLPDLEAQIEITAPVMDLELRIGEPLSNPELDPVARAVEPGWQLIGLPLLPPAGATLQEVVLDDATEYAFMYEQNAEGTYDYLTGAEEADRLSGYWLGSSSAFQWDMPGEYSYSAVTVPARNGWALVGNPIWFPASLNGVQISYGGMLYSWDDAITEGLVSGTVYGYNTAGGDYVEATSLLAWHGYWIRALTDGVEFVFDWYNFQTAQPLASVIGLPDLPDTEDWTVDVALRSPAGSAVQLTIEEAALATGLDRYYRQSLVDPASESFHWTLHLQADQPGAYELTWDRHDWPEDHDLQLYRPDQNRVIVDSLADAGGVTIDLGDGPVVLHLRTPSDLTGVGETPAVVDRVSASPNPFNPMTTLSLSLARGGEAAVAIYNVRGQQVARLDLGVLEAGRHQTTWQARDDQGRDLPSGVYFASLLRDGQRTGEVTKLSLVR